MPTWLKYSCVLASLILFLAIPAKADDAIPILNTVGGTWRIYHTLKPPVIQQPDGPAKPLLFNVAWLDWETPTPPADPVAWTKPEFDDQAWLRAPPAAAARTPYLARLSLRGKFQVTEPSRVKNLALALDYYGGAIVYLNGQEIGRQNLPPTTDPAKALADPYPPEAFVAPDGNWLLEFPSYDVKRDLARLAARDRILKLDLPIKNLRKGLNVLAIDIVRAPYNHIVEEKKDAKTGYILPFNTCELRRAQLTAASADGLIPSATRPHGMQIWTADPLAADTDTDFADPSEPLRPIALAGARNASLTAKFIVASDKPIRDIHITAGELRSAAATIPPAQISFLYGIPGGSEAIDDDSREEIPLRAYPQGVTFLNDLAAEPLKEYPVADHSRWALALGFPTNGGHGGGTA